MNSIFCCPRPLLGVLAMMLVAASSRDLSADETRVNVLMICVDDLKPNLRCYGDTVAITPHFDQLAARGVRFDSAYCNQAVCSPSRNSLMTGLRPQTIGIYDLPTHFRKAAPDAVTVTQHFIAHGYHASGLGKIFHVGHGNIDDEQSWSATSWRPSGPSYVDPANVAAIVPDRSGKKRGPATEHADVDDEAYADGKIATEAIARLKAYAEQPDQPFFLAVGFMKPHLPFVAPQSYWDLYDPATLPMPQVKTPPKDAPSYAPTGGGELRNYSDMPVKGEIDDATTRHLIHGYYAATSYTDAQAGKVLAALESLGLEDNTIVVLWGDHGWHLGDHGMWCKHTNYEQAARIPVIVAAPGGAEGAVAQSPIETVDIFPTLAELAKLPAPESVDGVSCARTVRNPADGVRETITHVYPRNNLLGRAIRDSRYRMVQWLPATDEPVDPAAAAIELYDYETDPLETVNIAADQPEIVQRMLAVLAKQPPAKPQWKAAKSKTTTANQSAAANKQPFDRDAAFTKRDADQDGYLTLDEFMSTQPDVADAAKRFPKFDTNHDERLDRAEYVGKASSQK